MDFAERLERLMNNQNVTKYRMSKDLSVSSSLVGYWISNERQPAKENLIKLADYFDVSIDYLVGRDDVPNRK